MFGCPAIYVRGNVEEKIVLILREKPKYPDDNGVWLATTVEHHPSLKRGVSQYAVHRDLWEREVTDWQVLPSAAEDFEESALRACDLVLAGDPRIGKVPGARRASKSKAKVKSKPKPAPQARKRSKK